MEADKLGGWQDGLIIFTPFKTDKGENIYIVNVDSNLKDQDRIDLFQPFGEVAPAQFKRMGFRVYPEDLVMWR